MSCPIASLMYSAKLTISTNVLIFIMLRVSAIKIFHYIFYKFLLFTNVAIICLYNDDDIVIYYVMELIIRKFVNLYIFNKIILR